MDSVPRPEGEDPARLILPSASDLDEEGLDELLACYRLLMARARQEGVLNESAGAAMPGEDER